MDLKTNLKRNKLVRFVRESFDPELKERRQHYDSWVRRYKYNKNARYTYDVPPYVKILYVVGSGGLGGGGSGK